MEEKAEMETLDSVDFEIENSSMANQATSSNAELLEMIESLRIDLNKERIAREVIVSATHRADKSLAKMLADAWRAAEEEKEAHRLSLEEISRQKEECNYYRHLFDQMQSAHNAERASAKEAQKALAALQEQLLEVQRESDGVLNQLVKVKVDYANKCMEFDDLERNYSEAVKLITISHLRIEQLEAKLAALTQQVPAKVSSSPTPSLSLSLSQSQSPLSSECTISTSSTPTVHPSVTAPLRSQADLRLQQIQC